jgi:hypothetical protein
LHEEKQRERDRPEKRQFRTAQKPFDESRDEPQGMQGYDREVVPLPPLDGTASSRTELVLSSENELEEPLASDEGDHEDE